MFTRAPSARAPTAHGAARPRANPSPPARRTHANPHADLPTHPRTSRRYEEIRVTFPAARARQLTALEQYRVRPRDVNHPSNRPPPPSSSSPARVAIIHTALPPRALRVSSRLGSPPTPRTATAPSPSPRDRARRSYSPRAHRKRVLLRVRQAAPPEAKVFGGEARLALAHAGVHHLHRAAVWAEALRVDLRRDAAGVSYDEYLDRGACSSRHAEARHRIRVDVPDVFPNHPRFVRTSASLSRGSGGGYDSGSDGTGGGARSSSDGGDGWRDRREYCLLDALERVLTAANARSPQGYVPAMCTVAGVLLLVTEDEETAFWMLTAFAEDLAPWLFSRSATPLCAEATALDAAVAHEFPALGEKLARASVRPSLLCAGWLTRLGVTVLPGEGVLRLWDALVLEGGDVLTQATLAFFRLCGEALARVAAEDDVGGGAAVLDAADDLAAGLFEMDPVVAAAVASARGVRDDVEWLRVRADARAKIASRVASLGSLRHFLATARERDALVAGVDGSNPAARITRDVFDAMVDAAYPSESELGAAARDARAALSRAFAAADAADARGEGATTSAMLAAARAAPDLAAAMRVVELRGDTPEARVRILLSGDPDDVSDAPDGRLGVASPSPARLAAGVRAARACAFGEADPAKAAAIAALESAMLFGRGGERWLERVRLSARGAFVLAAVTAAAYASAPAETTFDVSLAGTKDVVPPMRGLFAWPPRTPHTQYHLLVQAPGVKPYVLVKRYSDFRALHLDVEEEGLTTTVGPALSLPDAANFAGAFAPSSDPGVVAARRVALQRYVDLLAGSGCPDANRQLRVFLRLDDPPERRGEEGRGVFGCGMLDCGVGEFFGARAASW